MKISLFFPKSKWIVHWNYNPFECQILKKNVVLISQNQCMRAPIWMKKKKTNFPSSQGILFLEEEGGGGGFNWANLKSWLYSFLSYGSMLNLPCI